MARSFQVLCYRILRWVEPRQFDVSLGLVLNVATKLVWQHGSFLRAALRAADDLWRSSIGPWHVLTSRCLVGPATVAYSSCALHQ